MREGKKRWVGGGGGKIASEGGLSFNSRVLVVLGLADYGPRPPYYAPK